MLQFILLLMHIQFNYNDHNTLLFFKVEHFYLEF